MTQQEESLSATLSAPTLLQTGEYVGGMACKTGFAQVKLFAAKRKGNATVSAAYEQCENELSNVVPATRNHTSTWPRILGSYYSWLPGFKGVRLQGEKIGLLEPCTRIPLRLYYL